MSSAPTVQLDPTALDMMGMSVATSPPSVTIARSGTFYDPVTWAAAAPVWFHPVADQALMIATQRWFDATAAGGTPGAYSAVTIDTVPSWALVTANSGYRNAVPGQTVNLPMNTVATSVSVVGAVSRPPNLLFVLNTATVAGVPTAVLQRFHLGTNGSVTIASEDVLPAVGGVVFNAGIQYATPNLVIYGTDAAHQVYKVTKPWGQVGFNKTSQVFVQPRTANDAIGSPQGWQYYTGTGFSLDPTELAPITAADGTVLTSRGPMSFGDSRNQTFMTTVTLSGSTYSGQIWRSRSGQPFAPLGAPAALGSSSDGSYLGGGIYLQPQLAPNPAAAAMTADGVISGIPYLTWTRTSPAGGGHVLDVQWEILPISA